MLAFFTPTPAPMYGFGEFSIGRTAGKGIDGAGEAERRMEGEEPKEDRRLCEIVGGFMGKASDVGVPGIEGPGEAGARDAESRGVYGRAPDSCGAGLLADILRPGRSILVTLLCWLKVGCPSLVLRL